MKKFWYVLGMIALILGVNLLPQFVRSDNVPLSVGLAANVQVHQKISTDCSLIGAPAGYNYHGWPFVSYGPDSPCSTTQSVYVGSILANTLITTVAVVAIRGSIRFIGKRKQQ